MNQLLRRLKRAITRKRGTNCGYRFELFEKKVRMCRPVPIRNAGSTCGPAVGETTAVEATRDPKHQRVTRRGSLVDSPRESADDSLASRRRDNQAAFSSRTFKYAAYARHDPSRKNVALLSYERDDDRMVILHLR